MVKMKENTYNNEMEPLDTKIDELEKKIDALQHSIDKLRKIFLWSLILGVALFVLPLIGLAFVIPKFLSTYSGILQQYNF